MRLFVPQNYSPITSVSDPQNQYWLDENYQYLASFTNFRKVSVDYSATIYDYVIEMDSSTGNRTVTLPDPETVIGKQVIVVKIVPSNTVYVDAKNSKTIDGSSSYTITSVNYGYVVRFLAAGKLGWVSLGEFDGSK